MGRKRPAEDAALQHPTSHPQNHQSKRARLSPSAHSPIDSSASSHGSISEASALKSTPPLESEPTQLSSTSSLPSPAQSDIISSSSTASSTSTDSDDSSWDSDDDEIPTTIGGPRKPLISSRSLVTGAGDLKSRIEALLPAMAAANSVLEEAGRAVCMEVVDEDAEEGYIEMNLGLGVLEEKNEGGLEGSESESDSSSEESEEDEEEEDGPCSSGAVRRHSDRPEMNVMSRLLGQKRGRQKANIQQLG